MLRKLVSDVVDYFLPFRRIATHTVIPRYLPDHGVVLDVGANRGEFSRAIVESTHCKCYAVEANPFLIDGLRSDGRFEVVHAAMTGSNRTVTLAVAENSEYSSILEGVVPGQTQAVDVEGLDFATIVARLGLDEIDLLKFDIEGAEIEVLDSMTDAQLAKVTQLTIEFHDEFGICPASETVRVSERLRRAGFLRVCVLSGRTYDVAFLNRKRCPGSWWLAFRTNAVGRRLVSLYIYLRYRLATQRGL